MNEKGYNLGGLLPKALFDHNRFSGQNPWLGDVHKFISCLLENRGARLNMTLITFTNIRTYLKNNLSTHGSVAKHFKMLTYYVYAPLFHRFAPCPEP
jgi:hypothetical protein